MTSADRLSEMADPHFGEWLSTTKELQEQAFGFTFPIEGIPLAEYVSWNVTALTHEVGEMLNEIQWKPWVMAEYRGVLNRTAFIKEIVDQLHFIGNILVAVGCTDEEITELYRAKQQVNRDRQAKGYTGEKDADGRAIDDPS